MLRATTACTFSTSEPPKVVRTPGVLYILTWKCASRHNGVHFFDITTSKSGPTLRCFVQFDFKMCFAQNVQNTRGSEHFWKLRCRKSARRCGAKHISKSNVLKTDGLGPLLEVQMSKKCRTSARRCGAKHIWKATTACNFLSLLWPAGSAPAALASLLFDPPEPQIIGKTQCFATFLPFRASASSVFLLFLFYSSFF